MPSYYLDANALVTYYVEAEGATGKLNLRRLVSNHDVYISPLTSLEYVHVLMKWMRDHKLTLGRVNSLVRELAKDTRFEQNINRHPFIMLDLPQGLFTRAERLLLENGNFSIGSVDMLHLAIVEKKRNEISDLTMVTSDKGMIRVCKKINIDYFDPELSDSNP